MPATSSDRLAHALFVGLLLLLVVFPAFGQERDRLDVVTTTTDLREIAREVGGDDVSVTCLTKGPEDAHYLEARPSMIRAVASADVLVHVGMELEQGWLPVLLSEARNGDVLTGAAGNVDASAAIVPLEVPQGGVDRSQGHVHAMGNPHYLLDPVRAKRVARSIAATFSKLDPDRADAYRKRLEAFERGVDVAMFGEAVLESLSVRRLERHLQRGTLGDYLDRRKLRDQLGGHAARLLPYSGRDVVAYHGLFVYLLDRFHMEQDAKLEPKPGVAPTARHLAGVIKRMKEDEIRVVIRAPFHSARTVETVTAKTGAREAMLAHAPDATRGADGYLGMLAFNVDALAAAFAAEEAQ